MHTDNCSVNVEETHKKVIVEKVDKKTGEIERICMRFTGVSVTIAAPFGDLVFTATLTSKGFGLWRDSRTDPTARRSTHDTWDDLARTLQRFTDFEATYAALLKARQLMDSMLAA